MNEGIRFKTKVYFRGGHQGRKRLRVGKPPVPKPSGRVPLVSRLMALAIHFDRLLQSGEVRDQASLAAVGHVTRARVTQIMNLLQLAPDIQEEILFLPKTEKGRDAVREGDLRPITMTLDWKKQRQMWRLMKAAIELKAN
jgi:hypothetical protein